MRAWGSRRYVVDPDRLCSGEIGPARPVSEGTPLTKNALHISAEAPSARVLHVDRSAHCEQCKAILFICDAHSVSRLI
jgi:hypothetical protein